jgi:hypothetical protein
MDSKISCLTGNDTLILAGMLITAFAEGDNWELNFEGKLAEAKTGKNGNSVYALNATGRKASVKLRLIRGSEDDKSLNSLLRAQELDMPSFVLLDATLIKRLGDGRGGVSSDVTNLSGGIFSKKVPTTSNVEGNTDQAIAVYELEFTNSPRALQ